MREKEHNLQTIVKDELLKQNIKNEHEAAFLSAVIRGAGEISLSHKGYGLNIISDSIELIDKCNLIIKNRYESSAIIAKSQKNIGMRDISLYSAKVPEELAGIILEDCYIFKGFELIKGIPDELIGDIDAKKTYLRGIFLSCGHVSAPKDTSELNVKKGYHLEFSLSSELVTADLVKLLSSLCGYKKQAVRKRKNTPSLYIKSAQHISDTLAAMGASRGVMILQEIMAERAMRNHLNRGNNLIVANIDRSVIAAERQLKAIQKIQDVMGLEKLNKSLREVADLRIKNPNATLSEIAEIMGSKNLKSRINHRMRKIIEIANKL